jgi:hypothetical protein
MAHANKAHSNKAHAKQASKRRHRRTTLPVLGAAGMSLTLGGGASAATAPTENVLSQRIAPPPVVFLGEEEFSDVSLATFYVFDKESAQSPLAGVQFAAGCGGCRGCGGGCRGCGGVGRCGGCGGVGRCGGGCRCAVGVRCARCAVGCRACRCGCPGCVGIGIGCGGCGGGCGPCWTWTPLGWIAVC